VKVNRKSGLVSGESGDGMVYYRWRGKQVARRKGVAIFTGRSFRVLDCWAYFGGFSSLWHELPEGTKSLWNDFALRQGNATDVEANENVSYSHCPIPTYPPRPKLVDGISAFVGANMRAWLAGLDVPRIYPPLDLHLPTEPIINAGYEREKGELVIDLQTLPISGAEGAEALKAILWITVIQNKGYIITKRLLDVFDVPPHQQDVGGGGVPRLPAKISRRYGGIEKTSKAFGYKPLYFKEPPYLRVYVGAQIVMAPEPHIAPLVSSGTWTTIWILNDPRYAELEELIKTGEITRPGRIKLGESFSKYITQKREELANKFK